MRRSCSQIRAVPFPGGTVTPSCCSRRLGFNKTTTSCAFTVFFSCGAFLRICYTSENFGLLIDKVVYFGSEKQLTGQRWTQDENNFKNHTSLCQVCVCLLCVFVCFSNLYQSVLCVYMYCVCTCIVCVHVLCVHVLCVHVLCVHVLCVHVLCVYMYCVCTCIVCTCIVCTWILCCKEGSVLLGLV